MEMDQFRVQYVPGGMGLDYSAWWLCEWVVWRDGSGHWARRQWLRRANS